MLDAQDHDGTPDVEGSPGRPVSHVTEGSTRRVIPYRVMRRASIAIAACIVAGAALMAQVDINALGPQVGGRAFAFRLPDQRGVEQTLDSVAGPKGTMLVFFRSAEW